MSLVLFTCMVGLLIAPISVKFTSALISLLAVAIGSGAAGALNMWYESDLDALMSRTCLRPIPAGKIKKNQMNCFNKRKSSLEHFLLAFLCCKKIYLDLLDLLHPIYHSRELV